MADTLSRPPCRAERLAGGEREGDRTPLGLARDPLRKLPGEPLEPEQHDPIVATRRLAIAGRVVAPAGKEEADVVEPRVGLHGLQCFQAILDEPEAGPPAPR